MNDTVTYEWTDGECFLAPEELAQRFDRLGLSPVYAKMTCDNGMARLEHFLDDTCTQANQTTRNDISAMWAAEVARATNETYWRAIAAGDVDNAGGMQRRALLNICFRFPYDFGDLTELSLSTQAQCLIRVQQEGFNTFDEVRAHPCDRHSSPFFVLHRP